MSNIFPVVFGVVLVLGVAIAVVVFVTTIKMISRSKQTYSTTYTDDQTKQTNNCAYCGAKLKENEDVCSNCGAKLTEKKGK